MKTKCKYTGSYHLKSGLKLIGAKTKWRDFLYQLFPEHDTYIEPFIGSGTVLVGKSPSKIEIAGDLNEYAINFFNVIKTQPSEFYKLMNFELDKINIFGDREAFSYYKKRVVGTDNALMRAVFFYLVTKFCMNGIWRLNKKGECNSSFCGTTEGRGLFTEEWLKAVHERLKNVDFVLSDYALLVDSRLAGSSRPLVFLDPPYSRCLTTYNGIGWSDADFTKFLNNIKKWENTSPDMKFLLTINDNEFIRELFDGYEVVPHNVHYSCSQTNSGRGLRPELLIANYSIQETVNLLVDAGKKKENSKHRTPDENVVSVSH